MVSLEAEGEDLLTLRFGPPYAPGDEAAYLGALDAVAARAAPFALLAVFGGRGLLSQDAERSQVLWFKRTRAGMEARCRALAIVRPGDPGRSAAVFGRLWSFPVAVTASEAEGRAFLAAHPPR